MKKIVIALVVLVVVLVGAVLIVPSFIDWNSYKGQIVAAIRDNTGRGAAIDGDIAFTVLPAPALRVAGLRIENFEGAQAADMVRLKELRVRVSIGALLERRIVVERLELVEPVIALEVAKDGKASWDIDIAAAAGSDATSSEGDSGDAPLDISLADVRVSGGSLSFEDRRSGTSEKVEDLQMAIGAPSLSGPFDVTASARARGMPVSLELKTGALKPQQPLTIGLKAALTEADAELRFNGKMLAPIPTGLLSGKLEITGASAAKLASAAGQDNLPPVLAQPVSIEGTLMVSPDAVALNDTALKFGSLSGNGAVSVTLGETMNADIAVSVSRLNLDELLKQATAAPTTPSETAKPAESSTEPKAASSDPIAVELPKNINASFDLAIDVIQYRGSVIREAGLRAALANGEVTLDRAAALLPGGSDVSLLGFLSFIEGEPRFDGEVAAASDNLRSLLDWAGVEAGALPPDRLRGFSYASKVKVTPTAVEVQDINVRLDASTMTGGLAVALRDRPGFGLRLAIDQMNLDAYLPRASVKSSEGASSDKASSTAAASPAPASPLAVLNSFDANIDLEIDRLTVQKTLARKVRLDGLLAGGNFTIRKASVADFAGANANISGDVKDLAAKPSVGLKYRAAVNDPAKLFRFLGTPPPIPLRKLGKPKLSGRLDGTLDALSVKSDIAAAGAKLALEGNVKKPLAAPTLDLGMAINHPELAQFVRLAVPDFRPAAAKLGPLAAAFRLSGTPEDFALSGLEATAGPVQVKGTAAVRTVGATPYVKADLATSDVLVDLFRPPARPSQPATARGRAANSTAGGGNVSQPNGRWSRERIDFSGMQGVDADVTVKMSGLINGNIRLSQPVVEASLKSGQLDLKQFRAGIFGGTVSAKGRVNGAAKAVPMGVDVVISNVDLAQAAKTLGAPPRASGPLSANASLTMSGDSEAAIVSSLAGTGRLSGKIQIKVTEQENRAIGAVGLASALFGKKVKELKQVGGLTNEIFNAFGRNPADLTGSFAIDRGVLRTRDTVLNGRGARALTAGAVDLPRWLIDTNTSVARTGQQGQEPFVSVALTGSLDSPNPKVSGGFLKSSSPAPASNPIQQILPGVLGPKPDSGSGSGKVEPQDILRGLLKGFGR
ncbi:MAG: AsmA family protein [Rhodospirillaceae bacterium]|nr:AsmA family protein [Rhodospirillaceae bacterium]